MSTTKTPLAPGDVVKLGTSAQELHTIINVGKFDVDRALVMQHTTGKRRIVRANRCIVVRRMDGGVSL